MQSVLPAGTYFQKLGSRQTRKPVSYRENCQVLRVPCDRGVLLHHQMTGEILLLTPEEDARRSTDETLRAALIERWYLVPEDFDEWKLARQLRQIALLLERQKPGIDQFTIFPTTDCNARCFYCYELGRPRKTMTDQVALDTAAFIDRVRCGQDVKITWFGGEPLYNARAIDLICADLRRRGVPFSSRMISNGCLFDTQTVRAAAEDWNLRSVQITVDGTETVYNKTKAYIDCEGSAFRRVLGNVDLLLEAGIQVTVRLNMNRENARDLWDLSDLLTERFTGLRRPDVYAVLLRDFGRDARRFADPDEGVQAFEALNRRLIETGLGRRHYLSREIRFNRCMADNDRSVTVLPDGRLGKCEHESERLLIGSIYETEQNHEEIAAWKARVEVPACRTCLFAPTCIKLRRCSWNNDSCTADERTLMRANLRQTVWNEYQRASANNTIKELPL